MGRATASTIHMNNSEGWMNDLDWQGYAIDLEAVTTDPNLGTTGLKQARYLWYGDLVIVRFFFRFQGTGIDEGSGDYLITLPTNMDTTNMNVNQTLGMVGASDWSVAGRREVSAITYVSATHVGIWSMRVDAVRSGRWADDNPWTWAVDDRFGGTFWYRSSTTNSTGRLDL